MSTDIELIGAQKVKSLPNGQVQELKKLWEEQDVAIIFFRRWGCTFCRLWAKEVSEIAPVLQKNNIKLIGVGVEQAGSDEFIKKKFFDGDLYCVEDVRAYQKLGFKRFNPVSIIASLFWKQSRDAIFKGRQMGIETDTVGDGLQNGGMIVVKDGGKMTLHFTQNGPAHSMSNKEILQVDLGGDLKGDWGQTGGAVLVKKGGNLLTHFKQTGPADHLSNIDILKHFNLEHEYNAETMANKNREEAQCTTDAKP